MCRRTQWLNVGKADFIAACKARRIGLERAESLWARLDELARERAEKMKKEMDDVRSYREPWPGSFDERENEIEASAMRVWMLPYNPTPPQDDAS